MDGMKEALAECGLSDPYAELTDNDPYLIEDDDEAIDISKPKRFWKNLIFVDVRYLGSHPVTAEIEMVKRVWKRTCGSISTYEIRIKNRMYAFRVIR